jgi:hypothetical protein
MVMRGAPPQGSGADSTIPADRSRSDRGKWDRHGVQQGMDDPPQRRGSDAERSQAAMIYINRLLSPVFRVMQVGKDRMKVVLFDRPHRHYAVRWVQTRALDADDGKDLRQLQVDPLRYAPNLAELRHWMSEHPVARRSRARRR